MMASMQDIEDVIVARRPCWSRREVARAMRCVLDGMAAHLEGGEGATVEIQDFGAWVVDYRAPRSYRIPDGPGSHDLAEPAIAAAGKRARFIPAPLLAGEVDV